jgi:hypothetical protein
MQQASAERITHKLTVYLGGDSVAGGKLKEAGTLNWQSPNIGATNETGFTGLPGRWRVPILGDFRQIGQIGLWWGGSNTLSVCVNRGMRYSANGIFKSCVLTHNGGQADSNGHSIRCIKD